MRSDEIPQICKLEVDVPALGVVTGFCYNGITCQYLGIPYAEIPGRFRRAVPITSWEKGRWDGTKLGPYCPQPPRDFYPIPSPERSWLEIPGTDELNCLNLNISVPATPASTQNASFPVMVFLHGGAFAYSTGSSPVYDGRILAASSKTLSRPTIVVTINYRIGVYGFLGGHDLKAHNTSQGDGPVGGNLGLWDQVLALRWVKQHIAAFGGDPKRVTLFGQSAGAVSVHAHILRGEELFSSAILQSGRLRLCGVMSLNQHQDVYKQLLKTLGIPLELPASERFARLLAVGEKDLTAAMVPVFVIPVVTMPLCDDGFFLPDGMPSASSYKTFVSRSWCPRIMIGDARNECIIWNKSWDNMSPERLGPSQDLSSPAAPLVLSRMEQVAGPEKAATFASLYGLSKDSSNEETFRRLERMTSHGMYSSAIYFAVHAGVKSNPETDIWAYHFDVPSPFENAWGGLAHHSFDNVLIWGILRHLLPESHQKTGDFMLEAWIKFANGDSPWERFNEAKRWMVFGESKSQMVSEEEDQGRGYEIWKVLDKQGLVGDLLDLSDELCLRRSEVLKA